jgi:hypothetical protein
MNAPTTQNVCLLKTHSAAERSRTTYAVGLQTHTAAPHMSRARIKYPHPPSVAMQGNIIPSYSFKCYRPDSTLDK